MTSRIRVLQFTHDLKVGGLQRVVQTLCRSIDKTQFDVAVLCLREIGPLAEDLRSAGIPVHMLRRFKGLRNHTAFLQVARLLREERIDVVHTHNTGPFIHGVLGALPAGVKTVVHTDHARDFPDAWRFMVVENILARFAYRVVGVSEHSTSQLRRYERIPSRKLTTIINGVDASLLHVSTTRELKRQELGIAPDAPVLGIVARLHDQKGMPFLLQSVAMLRETFPDLVLLVAGDGPLEAELKQNACDLDIQDRVQFLGVRHDVPDLLNVFDLFVLPSLWEGLPMVILEAMAVGCPVLASDVGGVGRAIEHGVTGSLVPAKDVQSLTREISRLLTHEAVRQTYVENAKRKFEAEFSAAAMTRQYERLYRRQAVPTT